MTCGEHRLPAWCEFALPSRQEAIASECIKMIPLSDTPKSWAEEGVKLIDNCKKGANRALVKILSHYDINIEAKRLEGILKRLN